MLNEHIVLSLGTKYMYDNVSSYYFLGAFVPRDLSNTAATHCG